jgi:hypothetical protein
MGGRPVGIRDDSIIGVTDIRDNEKRPSAMAEYTADRDAREALERASRAVERAVRLLDRWRRRLEHLLRQLPAPSHPAR